MANSYVLSGGEKHEGGYPIVVSNSKEKILTYIKEHYPKYQPIGEDRWSKNGCDVLDIDEVERI